MNASQPLRARGSRPRRRGLSMVEATISMAVCTLLLTAASAAFVASAASVQVNGDFAQAAQTSRVALNQILAEIRRADAVSVSGLGTYVDVIRPAETAESGEVSRRFAYDATNKKLTLQVTYGAGAGTLYTLARNVSAATFGPAATGTDADGQTAVQQVPASFTVKVGKQTVTLTGSAGPRRSLAQ